MTHAKQRIIATWYPIILEINADKFCATKFSTRYKIQQNATKYKKIQQNEQHYTWLFQKFPQIQPTNWKVLLKEIRNPFKVFHLWHLRNKTETSVSSDMQVAPRIWGIKYQMSKCQNVAIILVWLKFNNHAVLFDVCFIWCFVFVFVFKSRLYMQHTVKHMWSCFVETPGQSYGNDFIKIGNHYLPPDFIMNIPPDLIMSSK